MRPVVVSKTGVGYSTPVVLDQYLTPENCGLAAIVTGTVTYSLEISQDDPFATYATDYNTNGNWFTLTGFSPAVSVTTPSNLAYPARAIRINIATGTGSVTLTVNQVGVR